MNRVDASRAFAKVLAYIACGRPDLARSFAAQLVEWWKAEGVL